LPSVQTVVKEETAVLGQPLKRVEDPRFITGTGLFADDIALPDVLHSVFVRSLYAHARIKRVDVTEALKQPAVKLVLTGQDLLNRVNKMPTVGEGGDTKPTDRPILPVDEVNFAGEAVALVVADDVYSAEDASELVQVEYESLPAVVDMERAASPDSPRVHEYLKDNIGYRSTKSSGDVVKAFREADHVIKLQQEFPRLSAVPMEPRNVIAAYEEASGFLTVWLSTQAPHEAREGIAGILKLPETKVRVIAPDMGGGFGQKAAVFPEYAAVCFAAMKLGRSVKWVETRGENLTASSHGRGQKQFIEAAVRKDGRILGLKARIICNGGAYSDWDFSMPDITIGMAPGVYDIPAFKAEAMTVFTNEPPIGAYRGAGRPEATYLIERTVDVIARRLKLDPVKVRLKNYVPKSKFPYKSAGGNTYDSGDYEGNLRRALELSRYDELRDFQREARAKGRLVGIGVVTYVEVCGFGPDLPQTASVAVSRHGRVTVTVGTNPHGQGHSTPFAQIVAQELGVDLSDIVVLYGDTAAIPWGTITAGSRSAVVGGSAVLLASRKIREKMSRIAAKMMGLRGDRMIFRDGKIFSGTSSKSLPFAEVAKTAYSPQSLPPGMEATLYEYCAYAPLGNAFPFGTHVTMVEVDRGTGIIKILKYVAVDDVGKVLNPLIVEGQVHGGVLQGVSQALLEQMVYDENGQPLTATLSDYLIPSTDTAPLIETYRTETPSPLNPLGVKGVGEAGTIGATPAIVNAVEDALSPLGVTVQKIPLTPNYVWSLINQKSETIDEPHRS